jgi:transcriptional regulator with XRE-family HTH domain
MSNGTTCLKAAGRNLVKLRASKGWTRQKLAKLVGLKEAVVAKMESGSAQIELAAWNKLSMCVQVPLADLLAGNSFVSPVSEAASNLASLNGLSPEHVRIVQELAEVLRSAGSAMS